MEACNSSERRSATYWLNRVWTCLFCRNNNDMEGMATSTNTTISPIFAIFLIPLFSPIT